MLTYCKTIYQDLPRNIAMKNKLMYWAFLLISNLSFSQTDMFYKIIFENEDNFKILKIFNGKIPKKFIMLDSTITFYPKSFWLENIDLNDKKVIKEIEDDEHHPFNNVYIFSITEYNNLFDENEKEYLSRACQKVKSKKIKIAEKKYYTVDNTNRIKGFYFLVSEPVYTSDNRFAFIEVDIKQKSTFLGEKTDDYFGVLKIIFEKDDNGVWKQIGNYDHIIL